MSEVKRYHWSGDHLDGIGYGCMYESVESGTKEMVDATDFDRVTAERDAAQGHYFELKEAARQLIDNAVDDEGAGEMVVQRADIDELRPLIAALKPADGADYRMSCEASHKALSMENQRILAPGQFKCLACGDIHPGSGNLPCPKMSPTA